MDSDAVGTAPTDATGRKLEEFQGHLVSLDLYLLKFFEGIFLCTFKYCCCTMIFKPVALSVYKDFLQRLPYTGRKTTL